MACDWKISRRRMLRGLGATMALPYLEVMGNDGSRNSGPPVRLCCVFQPNGMYPAAWDLGVPVNQEEKTTEHHNTNP